MNSRHIIGMFLFLSGFHGVFSQGGESTLICEFKPLIKCFDPGVPSDSLFKVHESVVAIQRDGLNICEEAALSVNEPDIVLIMDNTGSMGVAQYINNTAHYCMDVGSHPGDPQCISGDPYGQRAEAFHTFLDSAVQKTSGNTNIGVVLYNKSAYYRSKSLTPLTPGKLASIKSEIVMKAEGRTNYTAALTAARELLSKSDKPKDEQAIIFLSDGRPNEPRNNPYVYKSFLAELPDVHTIFLGDNANAKDMESIATATGGLFFATRDIGLLARILTDSIGKQIFQQGLPQRTVVTNQATGIQYIAEGADHVFHPGLGYYTLNLNGPVLLETGFNTLNIQTAFDGGAVKNTSFKVERGGPGPFSMSIDSVCRELPYIVLYNDAGTPISQFGASYSRADTKFSYEIVTAADLDTFAVRITTTGQDTESQKNDAAKNKKDSVTWANTMPFAHESAPNSGDGKLQTDDGDRLSIFYQNPFLPDDKASLTIYVHYGPSLKNATYYDRDGDGSIETVVLDFETPLNTPPDKLEFNIRKAEGEKLERRTASLADGEIAFAKDKNGKTVSKQLVVTLQNPFPKGVTSMTPFPDSYGHSFQQANVPISEKDFSVIDSVAPIITKVKVSDPEDTENPQTITVTFSEPVTIDPNARQPLVIKRMEMDLGEKGVTVTRISPVTGRSDQYVFELSQGSAYYVVGGDSVAINPNGYVQDPNKNTPKKLRFVVSEGKNPNQQMENFSISHPKSQERRVAYKAISGNKSAFILVGKSNSPLEGNTNGKCGDCYVGRENKFVGPVFSFDLEFPVTYTFTVYNNLGYFINSSRGEVAKADLSSFLNISGNASRPKYRVRVVWDGRDEKGSRVGSGAFVLYADFHFSENKSMGSKAAKVEVSRRFGFVR